MSSNQRSQFDLYCTCIRTRSRYEATGQGPLCPFCTYPTDPPRPPSDEQSSVDSDPIYELPPDIHPNNDNPGPVYENMEELGEAIVRFHDKADEPKFSGSDSENLESFISKLDRYCTDNGKPLDYKVKRLPYLLTNKAYTIYDSFPHAIREDYDQVCNELRLHFGRVKLSRPKALQKLYTLKKPPSMSVQKFYEQLTTNRPDNVDDDSLQAFFLLNLPTYIRNYVENRRPNSLQETVVLALEAEETSSEFTPTFSDDIVADVRDIKRFLSKQASFQSKEAANAIVKEDDTSISRLTNRIDKLITTYNSSGQSKGGSNCQICSKFGHSAADCRSRFGNTVRNPSPVTPLLCQLCNKKNHSAINCNERHLFNQLKAHTVTPRCQLCNSPGHLALQCRTFQTQRRGNNDFSANNQFARQNNSSFRPNFQPLRHDYSPRSTYPPGGPPSVRKIVCSYCNKTGHLAKNCFALERQNNRAQPNQHNSSSTPPNRQSTYRTDPRNVKYFGNVSVAQLPTERVSIPFISDLPWSMTIPVNIHGVRGTFLIDTGSSIDIIDKDFLRYLGRDLLIYPSKMPSINTVDGNSTTIFGQVVLPTELDEGVLFHIEYNILSVSLYDGLLGRQFLSVLNAFIDFTNETITVDAPLLLNHLPDNTKTIKSVPSNPVSMAACLKERVIIPPLSELVTTISAGPFGPNEEVILDRIDLTHKPSIMVASSLGVVRNSCLPCRLLNMSAEPITLPKGMQIGTLSLHEGPIMSTMVTEMDESPPLDTTNAKELDFKIHNENLSEAEKKDLLSLLHEFDYIFAHSDNDLGCTDLMEHHIVLENTTPIRSRPYRTDRTTREAMREHIQTMLDNDIIQESSSPYASPVILVKKRDNTSRFVVDYRKLNAVTKKDAYPLPLISDIFDSLSGAAYFSCLDLIQGYHQIPVAEESRQYTAFITYDGLWEFKRLPFGLCNAPSGFQRLMEMVLRGLNYSEVLIYLDDCIVFSRTFPEHLQRLRKVFTKFEHAGLKLKPSKCVFAKQEVQFLGHIVNKDGISPSDEKTKIIDAFPTPKTCKQVKVFLGLTGYYRRFVPNFAQLSVPLNKLLRKNTPFKWTSDCQASFEALKAGLTNPPLLIFPNFEEPFHLWTDASGTAIGMSLGQIIDGNEKVISYAGRVLTKPERNYTVTELEALAVIEALRQFHCYLYGRTFIIHTDHSSLLWLFTTKDLNPRSARWALKLQNYDFTIQHKAGSKHANADAISRMHDNPVCSLADSAYQPQKIRALQRADPELIQLICFLETKSPYTISVSPELTEDKSDNFFLDKDGILFKHGESVLPFDPVARLVVPKSLRKEILLHCHDSPLAGHFGFDRTYSKIKLKYYWPFMYSEIKDWVATCEPCNKRKRYQGFKPAPLHPIPVGLPFDRVSVDITGPFPTSEQGNKYIIFFLEHHTKWLEGRALKTIDSKQVALAFFELIVCRFGTPHTILSDRGANFLSSLMKEIYKIMNTHKLNTSSYKPSTNGAQERINLTIIPAISMYIKQFERQWDTFLHGVLFGYRTTVSAATGFSPYLLLFGRHPNLPMDVQLLGPSKLSVSESEFRSMIVKNLAIAQEMARQEIDKNQEKYKERFDKTAREPTYSVGQKVLVHDPKTPKGSSKKLRPQYIGPFEIVEQISPLLFKLTGLPDRTNEIIHANRLRPFPEPGKHSLRIDSDPAPHPPRPQIPPRSQVQAQSNDSTEIPVSVHEPSKIDAHTPSEPLAPKLEIIDHRSRRKSLEYLCKQPHEPVSLAVWLRPEQINDPDLIRSYLDNRPNRPHTRSRTLTNVAPLCTIAFLIAMFASVTTTPSLGPLYDCDSTKYEGVFALPSVPDCPEKKSKNPLSIFNAKVSQYHPARTSLTIHHCVGNKITLTCKEKFFGSDDKKTQVKQFKVSPRDCLNAVSNKNTPFGPLYKVSKSTWRTNNHLSYTCKWMRRTSKTFDLFQVSSFQATLVANDKHIHQYVTSTTCLYKDFSCVPDENRDSVITWPKVNHRTSLYIDFGVRPVRRMQDFVLCPSLGIGGSIVYSSASSFLLDSGYKILFANESAKERLKFESSVNTFLKSSKFNVRDDIAEGHFIDEIIRITESSLHLTHYTCGLNKEIRQLQRWLLSTFPDVAASYLFPDLGRLVEPLGDGLLVHKCKPVDEYVVLWNQTFNGSCYYHFPVILPGASTVSFLDLARRRVMSHSHTVSCPPRNKPTFIYDIESRLWRLDTNDNFYMVNPIRHRPLTSHLPLSKLAHFSTRLLHYDKKEPSRFTLLQILAQNKESLETIKTIKASGAGDFMTGLGKTLGTTLSSVASGTSQVIRSFGAAIHDSLDGVSNLDEHLVTSLGSATKDVIDSSTTGFAKIISSFGGLFNFVLWILVIILYLIMFYQMAPTFYNTAMSFRRRPALEQADLAPPPPVRVQAVELLPRTTNQNTAAPPILERHPCPRHGPSAV